MPDCKSEFETVPDVEMQNHPLGIWKREGDLKVISGK